MIERVPPNDAMAECAVLGSVLLDPHTTFADASAIVRAEDFYDAARARVWAAMEAVANRGEPPEPLLVLREWECGDERGEASAEALSDLAAAVSSPAHVAHYAALVKRAARCRAVIQHTAEAQQAAYRGDDDAVDRLETALSQLRSETGQAVTERLGDRLDEALERLRLRVDPESGASGVLTWRVRELDSVGGFLQEGDFAIVSGSPGAGKSSWVLDWAIETAARRGPVLFCSLEMPAAQVRRKALLQASRVANPAGRGLNDMKIQRLRESMAWLQDVPVILPTHIPRGIGGFCSWLRSVIHHERPVAVVVDYLGQLDGEGTTLTEKMTSVSVQVRGVAKTTNIPIVAVHSMNRESSRDRRPPEMRDLRQSGQLEYDGTHVLFLWRPWDSLTEEQRQRRHDFDENEVWLCVEKAREAPRGMRVKMIFDGATGRMLPKAKHLDRMPG